MVSIRLISIDDIALLQAISKETFIETYESHNTSENLEIYLNENFSTKQLQDEINNPESKYHFAEINDEVVGYLKTNLGSAQTEVIGEKTLEIERIYVSQKHHGKKIGQALFNKAIDLARAFQAEYVWLGVWENNTNAIGFYERMGFEAFGTHAFMFGNEKQIDIMMKYHLK